MSMFLELVFAMAFGVEGKRFGWVQIVTLVCIFIGLVGIIGLAGYVPLDLEALRGELGWFGRHLFYWETLIAILGAWFVVLLPLAIYGRLRDSSIGNPDNAED